MTDQERKELVYNHIAKLAKELYNQGKTMTYLDLIDEVKKELNDTYGSPAAMSRAVIGAYDHFHDICRAIDSAFTNENGGTIERYSKDFQENNVE